MYNRIGIVIATQEELDAFIREIQKTRGKPLLIRKHEFEIFIWESIFWKDVPTGKNAIIAIHSHIGEISAAASTQLLISEFKVNIIINYGVAGSIVESISVGDVFVVSRIIHYDFNLESTDHRYPRGYYPSYGSCYLKPSKTLLNMAQRAIDGLQRVTCTSSDTFADVKYKRRLAAETYAQICDMECAAVYLVCRKNNIPCLILKAISDNVDEGDEAFNNNVDFVSEACANILVQIIRYLAQISTSRP